MMVSAIGDAVHALFEGEYQKTETNDPEDNIASEVDSEITNTLLWLMIILH